jgi:hypothetical protein
MMEKGGRMSDYCKVDIRLAKIPSPLEGRGCKI